MGFHIWRNPLLLPTEPSIAFSRLVTKEFFEDLMGMFVMSILDKQIVDLSGFDQQKVRWSRLEQVELAVNRLKQFKSRFVSELQQVEAGAGALNFCCYQL